MSEINHYELRPLHNSKNEYELVLFLDELSTEFGDELGIKIDEKSTIFDSAKKIVAEKYPAMKITMIRVMVSGVIMATLPVASMMASAQTVKNKQDGVQMEDNAILYAVQPSDTLWNLSQRFHTTVDLIKKANHLQSDKLKLNQQITIPKAIHTVLSGESISVIARDYGISSSAIMKANQLDNDRIFTGQILVIPQLINQSPIPAPMYNHPKTPSTYKVEEGDTLSKIAKQHQIPINFLMINNHLTNEIIKTGQVLQLTENFKKGNRNEIGTLKIISDTDLFSKKENGELTVVKSLATGGAFRVYSIDYENSLYNVGGNNWVKITPDVQFVRVGETSITKNSVSYVTHNVVSGDTIWGISVKYGVPQYELLKLNHLTLNSPLSIGQSIKVPQYKIAVKPTVSGKHGEYLDWWTEAQYVVPIGKTFKVRDFATGKTFMVKRTIGANHADCETLTTKDTNIAKGIWNGFSWTERPVIIEVDGRKIAASMSFMPHEQEYIINNGITGHFDIHFKNSTRHKDGKIDYDHQKQISIAAGVKGI